MVYDWDGKEADCYRLYVEERRSLDEVMDFWRIRGFSPSKRAFQTQFKRWDFPSKQNPAHKNAALVARVKELWEKNVSQRDMLQTLNDEGHDIKERELMRVRAKNRWLLRVPNGMKGMPTPPLPPPSANVPENVLMQELQEAINQENAGVTDGAVGEAPTSMGARQPSPEPTPEVLRKRKERLDKLQQESEERWRTRKRRRRTRGWAGLPADPEGPPRFPSETTIDESKAYLKLDNEMYRQLRDQFQTICEEESVIKKTLAGPEKWQQVKDRLIRENEHLQTVFWDEHSDKPDQRTLSLDVICTDVTKRMRTLERRMTIAEAKNVIGVNPEESRTIRTAFYNILKADHFTSKLETGDEHWQELKQQWFAECDIIKRILAPGDSDPQHQDRLKALEVLCRDVMKRLRDDQTKRDPSRKKQANTGPGPGPAPPRPGATGPRPQGAATSPMNHIPAGYAPTAPMMSTPATSAETSSGADIQIDPSLLLAASDLAGQQAQNQVNTPAPMPSQPEFTMPSSATTTVQQQVQDFAAYAPQSYSDASPTPIPVYFRLHPHSAIQTDPRLWLGALTSGTMDELRALATRNHAGATVVRIEGVVKGHDFKEVNYSIDDNEELGGYLAHMSTGKVTFAVQLA
ncbi:uncharacterized protein K452DRAFT_360211 [Aplosporella prunicola CBS 121167]|uniref:Uncharacterized protein n=1 Tax=Aplosporella prunicola CBS 121167 TaxID=1176127 RepID=A0A6A6BBZ8_9PEZI|nr:uncharacterized protein K452DRAFT_360211 [Aplosporella prunicola CBS 121167]KAF2140001.1 hypothetical protein K452DRAFT_360211 [Aplosporella prunicola CBS 121167]